MRPLTPKPKPEEIRAARAAEAAMREAVWTWAQPTIDYLGRHGDDDRGMAREFCRRLSRALTTLSGHVLDPVRYAELMRAVRDAYKREAAK